MNYNLHNISKYIYNTSPISYEINHTDINYYCPDNLDITTIKFYYNFINHMNNQKKDVLGCYFNNVPIFKISEEERNIIKNKFLPTNDVQLKIKEKLNILNFKEKDFCVIHIRSGDKFMNYNTKDSASISNTTFKIYQEFIEKILEKELGNQKGNYIILSDNQKIKIYLNGKNPMYKIMDSKIAHCALNGEDGLLDTIVDFFLMTQSHNILSFSFLGHGTGFSEYAAQLYNIPYKVNIFK
jgi:hypothetical protein